MTTIRPKLPTLNLMSRPRGYSGVNLEALSDRALKDIGFRLDRRDLNSVRPFWLA